MGVIYGRSVTRSAPQLSPSIEVSPTTFLLHPSLLLKRNFRHFFFLTTRKRAQDQFKELIEPPRRETRRELIEIRIDGQLH